MAISVQPLVLTHSFAAMRNEAQDSVDLAALDVAFTAIAAKLNEIILALGETMREDDTLMDGALAARHLSDDARAEVVAIVNTQVDAAS